MHRFPTDDVEMPVGNYWLPVTIGGAEPQKDDGTARVWIADQKLYPTIPTPR